MKRAKIAMTTLCLIGALICIVLQPQEAKQGAVNGLNLCQNIIMPSLLPTLIITNIIVKTRCSDVFNKIFGKFTTVVLRLPKCATSAIIFGLIAGYPTGAILTNYLFNSNQLTSYQAKRIMKFNFCGGIGFIVFAVGGAMLNSIKLGFILYIINIAGCILVAFVGSFFSKKIENNLVSNQVAYYNFSNALVLSVEQSVNTIMQMSGYIILFSALCNIIHTNKYITPLLEITNGISLCANNVKLSYLAGYLAFGGVCLHLQIAGILNNIKMKYSEFLLWRVLIAVISIIGGLAVEQFVPQSISVFSNASQITSEPYQINYWFSSIMVLGSAVLILDINERVKYKKASHP